MRDFFECCGFITLGFILLIGAITGLCSIGHEIIDQQSCHAKWAASGYQARWSFWGDCQISKDGRTWMPEDVYRDIHKDVQVSQ